MNTRRPHPTPPPPARLPACEDIRDLLLGYLTRELGDPRSDLIREHLRKCPACQAAAAELQATLDLLHDASSQGPAWPARLSPRHHARLVYALTHPLMDWVHTHHALVSALVTALLLALVARGLLHYHIWRSEKLDPGVTVTIGSPGAP